ncbi:hypothetical protein ACWFQT_20180, partial [Cellulosimicrobium cellulans]
MVGLSVSRDGATPYGRSRLTPPPSRDLLTARDDVNGSADVSAPVRRERRQAATRAAIASANRSSDP